ncbi:hypothetical protein LSTR_LSTR007595 [Laodelphax striatellus]|uniref:Uncharacterized protein n=1 Tax=Laodelphax striatellus TaxID=195883 RepID=A0A482XM80_LAOST|nr:hypothetical protein LSTR_LSTR007595 [Laodelphax striatellus]
MIFSFVNNCKPNLTDMWSVFSALILILILLPEKLLGDPVREFEYKLEKSRVYTTQISHGGLDLIVGTDWAEIVEDTILECKLRDNAQDYRPNYLPKVQLKEGMNETPIKQDHISDYFVVTKKEIWACTDKRPNGKALNRIVTELISKVEVSRILYYDGVEVTSKQLIGEARSAVIREVKYYNTYNSKVIRFDGKVELPETYKEMVPDKSGAPLVNSPRVWNSGSFKEIKEWRDYPKEYTFGNTGGTIKIGTNFSLTLGDDNSVAECEKYQGVLSDFPFGLRPKIEIDSRPVTNDNYTEYITPLREEIWLCKVNGDNGFKFWRTINDIMSTPNVPLKIAKFYDVVTDSSAVKPKPKDFTNVIRARVITYYELDPNNVFRARVFSRYGMSNVNRETSTIKYTGYIKLLSPEKQPELKILKSSIDLVNVETTELEYYLQPGRAFRAFVSKRGLNIRVGTAWTKQIGKADDVVQCNLVPSEIEYSFDYGTRFRLILKNSRQQFYRKAIPRSQHGRYWEYIRQQVWLCQQTAATPGYKFLRIVNELKGKKELHEVEYYDSVQLYSRTLDGSRRTVNLIEIKYIDQADFQVYKYEGKLILTSPSEIPKNFIDCLNCDGQPIRKVEYEIVFDDSAYKKSSPYVIITERVYYELINTECWFRSWPGQEKAKLNFLVGVDPSNLITLGTKEDIAECEKIDERKDEFYSYIMEDSNPYENYKKIPVTDYNAKGVEMLVQEVWFCQKDIHRPGSHLQTKTGMFKMYRVYNKFKVQNEKYQKIRWRDGVAYNYLSTENSFIFQETRYLTTNLKEAKYEGKTIFVPKLTNHVTCGTLDLTASHLLDSKSTEHQSNGPGIIYELDKKRIHKLTVNETGELVMEMGQKWTKRIIEVEASNGPRDDMLVRCERNYDISLYEFTREYRTYVQTYPEQREDKLEVFEMHFVLKNWEVWDCASKSGQIMFTRVVTNFELKRPDPKLTVRTIKEIRYHDGVTVYKGTLPSSTEDIKYGWLFREVRYTERSMSYQLDTDDKMFKTMFEPGTSMKVGSRYEKEIIDSRTLNCVDHIPDASQTFETEVEVALPEKYSFKYVKLADQSIVKVKRLHSQYWMCTPIEESTPGTDIKLIRVKNRLKVEGRVPIGQLLHYDGVTITFDGKAIEEIKFIDASDKKVVKFDGFLIMDKFNNYDMTDISRRRYREIDYVLDTSLTYVRKLSEGRSVFQIDSSWHIVKGDSQQTAECYISTKESHSTTMQSRIKTVKNYKMEDLDYTRQSDYPFFQSQSAYKCFSPQFGSFVKMVSLNVLKDNSQYSEFYYGDGVTIWFANNTNVQSNGPVLHIREVRFLNITYPTQDQVIKFGSRTDGFSSPPKDESGRFCQNPFRQTVFDLGTFGLIVTVSNFK